MRRSLLKIKENIELNLFKNKFNNNYFFNFIINFDFPKETIGSIDKAFELYKLDKNAQNFALAGIKEYAVLLQINSEINCPSILVFIALQLFKKNNPVEFGYFFKKCGLNNNFDCFFKLINDLEKIKLINDWQQLNKKHDNVSYGARPPIIFDVDKKFLSNKESIYLINSLSNFR
jgi:hypothetical protein